MSVLVQCVLPFLDLTLPVCIGSALILQAPVSCDVLFSLDWFIVFYYLFVVLLIAVFLFSKKYTIARPMITSLLSIATVLMILMANTWYRAFDAGGGNGLLNSSFSRRAKVLFSGALIGSIANFGLLIVFGLETDKDDQPKKSASDVKASAASGGEQATENV